MSRVIDVTVSPQGEITMQTRGYAGGDCFQASQVFEQALRTVAAEHRAAESCQARPAELQAPEITEVLRPSPRSFNRLLELWHIGGSQQASAKVPAVWRTEAR